MCEVRCWMRRTKVVREQGDRGLSVAQVLEPRTAEHAGVLSALRFEGRLGIRGVPADGSRRDTAAEAEDGGGVGPAAAVVAWIDGRLDLAFNAQIRSDLRQMSLEAQTQMFAAPELVAMPTARS